MNTEENNNVPLETEGYQDHGIEVASVEGNSGPRGYAGHKGTEGVTDLTGMNSSDIELGKRAQTREEREQFQKLVRKFKRSAGKPRLTPFRNPEPKIGRNKKCVCGSGKKYKVCCLL